MASIDFFRLKHGAGGGCGSNLLEWGEPEPAWVTAVADGRLRTVRGADGEPIPCWAEVEHAGGWTSWYYHVQQIQADADGAFVRRGQRVARLATTREAAECFGGDAREHPHLHFSLLANGSFVGLHGVQLSRWVVHAGECSYDCRCEHAYLALAAAPSCRRCPLLRAAAPARRARRRVPHRRVRPGRGVRLRLRRRGRHGGRRRLRPRRRPRRGNPRRRRLRRLRRRRARHERRPRRAAAPGSGEIGGVGGARARARRVGRRRRRRWCPSARAAAIRRRRRAARQQECSVLKIPAGGGKSPLCKTKLSSRARLCN